MRRLLFCFLVLPQLTFAFGIDLHNHLFMREGVRLIFQGNFYDEDVLARHWKHSRKNQITEEMLKKTELSIVVASLYAARFSQAKQFTNPF